MSAAKILDLESGLSESPPNETIGVANSMLPEDVIRLVKSASVNHVVQKDNLFFDAELLIAKALILDPAAFVHDPLGVLFESVFKAEGPIAPEDDRRLSISVSPTDKKSIVLGKFEEFLETLPRVSTIRDSAFTVADELFTNGVKNAWPEGSNRKTALSTIAGTVDFFARADGKRLVIGCKDSFGLLGFSKILDRIQACYENGVAQSISQGDGGAGIGSFMVFNNSVSYYAAVRPGHHTVVCVALPLGISARKLAKLSKNIHLVTVK